MQVHADLVLADFAIDAIVAGRAFRPWKLADVVDAGLALGALRVRRALHADATCTAAIDAGLAEILHAVRAVIDAHDADVVCAQFPCRAIGVGRALCDRDACVVPAYFARPALDIRCADDAIVAFSTAIDAFLIGVLDLVRAVVRVSDARFVAADLS